MLPVATATYGRTGGAIYKNPITGRPNPNKHHASDGERRDPRGIEICTAAKRLRNGRVGGISGIRAEDTKAWMGAAIAVEQGKPPLGDETSGDGRDSFTGLIQSI